MDASKYSKFTKLKFYVPECGIQVVEMKLNYAAYNVIIGYGMWIIDKDGLEVALMRKKSVMQSVMHKILVLV